MTDFDGNTVIAIDPGVRNGVAHLAYYSELRIIGVYHLEILDKETLIKDLNNPLVNYRGIICEDWITTSHMSATQHREVLTTIGNIEHICSSVAKVPLIMRKPQQREIARKAFGFCKKAHDNDAFSAMLHGISYLMGSRVTSDLEIELSDSVQNFFKENKLYPLDKRISIRYNDFVEGQ